MMGIGQLSRAPDAARERVARDYHAAGYRVIMDPPGAALPRDIAALRPEMVALRDGENVVVELVPSERAADRERLRTLAAALLSRPGWRFDVVLGDDDYLAPPDYPKWRTDEITCRLDDARRLVEAGQGEAAILLLFALAEAAGRALARAEHIDVQHWDPVVLFGQLVQHGALDEQDKIRLGNALRARNQIMHGESVGNVESDLEQARELIDVIDRMLVDLRAATAATGQETGEDQ